MFAFRIAMENTILSINKMGEIYIILLEQFQIPTEKSKKHMQNRPSNTHIHDSSLSWLGKMTFKKKWRGYATFIGPNLPSRAIYK